MLRAAITSPATGLDPRGVLVSVAHVGHDGPLGLEVSTPAITAAVLGFLIAGVTVQLRMFGSLSRRWVAVGFVAAAAFLALAGVLAAGHV